MFFKVMTSNHTSYASYSLGKKHTLFSNADLDTVVMYLKTQTNLSNKINVINA
jgi:hypothetical protein